MRKIFFLLCLTAFAALLTAQINPGVLEYQKPQLTDLYRRLLERVTAIPGVRSASLSLDAPISMSSWTNNVTVAGYTPQEDENLNVHRMVVTPDYFVTVGLPLIEGRGFTEQDTAGSTPVAVVNETMAHYFFPNRSAVGSGSALEACWPAGASRSWAWSAMPSTTTSRKKHHA